MKPFVRLACLVLLSLMAAAPAYAQPLLFSLTGSRNASFQLDSNPIPTSFSTSAFGDQIQFSDVAGTFNGLVGTASSISFGTAPIFADLNINGTSLGFTQFAGPTLFGGTAAAPIFSVGTFALTSIVSGNSTLTISQAPVSAAPEPSAWALMLGGVGMAGLALRRRRQPTTRVKTA